MSDTQGSSPGVPETPQPPTVELQADALADYSAVPEAAATASERDLVVPFGDYELLGEIGRGGMGVVYRARERKSGQMVALKMMSHERAPRPSELRRFRLEARATSQLNHPGIVTIHAWGEHASHLFYTMDLVQGVPLNRLMEKGPLPPDQAVRYLVGMAQAVAVAHAQGIIHRDLKPSNVIIAQNDLPCILDFGLAKQQRPAVGTEVSAVDSIAEVLPAGTETLAPTVSTGGPGQRPTASRATEKGTVLGTPSYMAPEQARGDNAQVCPATDIHALGCIFYEMLVGRPPFQGGSVAETVKQVIEREPAAMWVEGNRVPEVLEAICRRCLQKDPWARYADAAALADDLERRWERARQGPRFARLALAAGCAGVLLLAVRQLLSQPGWTPASLTRQILTTPAGSIPEEVATVLTLALDAMAFTVGPVLALGTALGALAAWAWHTERARRIGVVAALALLGGSLMLLADPPQFGVALFLLAVPLVIGVTAVSRLVLRADRTVTHSPSHKAEPFLQRLLVAGARAQPEKGRRAPGATVTGLADIELGKAVHHWEGGQLRRGHQKSLDRAVLVWLETSPAAAGAPVPGVLVRHPHVLSLHAVGSGPEGRSLVTEFVPATLLLDILQREQLPLRAAVRLAVKLARAVGAIHDQGAYLGALRPEWIMLRGDLEPLLCPWCIPSQSGEEPSQDCSALGQMLLTWLPLRSAASVGVPPLGGWRAPHRLKAGLQRGWQRQPSAAVYEVCDAAARGTYTRMGDLADDLDSALRELAIRQRKSWLARTFVLLTVLPWFFLLVEMIGFGSELGPEEGSIAQQLLLALVPAAVLLGYAQGRALGHRFGSQCSARIPPLTLPSPLGGEGRVRGGRKRDAGRFLGQLALLVVPPVLFYGSRGGGLAAFTLLVGYWVLGSCVAGLVTVGVCLARSFQPLFASRSESATN